MLNRVRIIKKKRLYSNFAFLYQILKTFSIYLLLLFTQIQVYLLFLYSNSSIKRLNKTRKLILFLCLKYFTCKRLILLFNQMKNITSAIEFIYKYKLYNIDINKIVFSIIKFDYNSIERCFNLCANTKNV